MTEPPLRVAFLLPSFPELSNTFILEQITGLIDRGHHLDIFAIERKDFGILPLDLAPYRLAERMRHHVIPRARLARLRLLLNVLGTPSIYHPALLDAFDRRHHGRSALNLVQFHTAASFLRAGPYDILHCQFGDLGPTAARLVGLGAVRARLVTSFRGADLTIHLAAQPRRFTELFARGALFLPVSEHFRDRLVAAGARPECVEVHRSGIDLRRFTFALRHRPAGRPRLLFVGRLTEKKGLEYALEALARLRTAGTEADFTVIGEGALLPHLKTRCTSLGLDDRVSFLGARSRDDVASAMAAAHVLVAPSVTAGSGDQEGIPNVVKEAMATGMPVVSTHHSGIPELVEHGVTGFLARERDPADLARQIAIVLEHPERWGEIGTAARHRIEVEYDRELLNDALVERYRRVLRESSGCSEP